MPADRPSILHLVEEAASGGAGSDVMLAKLSEVLFVHAVVTQWQQNRGAAWQFANTDDKGSCDVIALG
jgi:hypothetical protein